MWELINQNKQRSIFLFIVMGLCLLLLGSWIGRTYGGQDGWAFGLVLAMIIWIIMSLVSFFSGDKIILSISHAQKVTPQIHPQLFNVVEEMKIAAGLPAMPSVYIIPEEAPNAFATGRNPQNSAIVVTAGLVSRLNRNELQGVIAHETAHILNRDILYMTFSGVLLGSIVLLSHTFLRSLWFSGGGRSRRSSSKGGGQAQMIMVAVAVVFAILAPLLARLLYLAISRKREYLADATAVRLTRYPEGLASALEKLSQNSVLLESANKATAGLYIVNPLHKAGKKISNLSSTHPPIDDRIRILRTISGGANYSNYQSAYDQLYGNGKLITPIIPVSGLSDPHDVPLKKVKVQAAEKGSASSHKDLNDLIKAIDKYFFIPCDCGLEIKVPPDFARSTINCPKCDRAWPVPTVLTKMFSDTKNPAADISTAGKDQKPLIYVRKGKNWESFQCSCGAVKQLSPGFSKSNFECNHCRRKIIIKPYPA